MCRVCGAVNHTCGPSGTEPGVNITSRVRTETAMADLKSYSFTADDGRTVTLRLSKEDAEKRGLTSQSSSASVKQQQPDGNKARTPRNK